jgi:hypothetical protein
MPIANKSTPSPPWSPIGFEMYAQMNVWGSTMRQWLVGIALVLMAVMGESQLAFAEFYNVTVTRRGSNLYRIDGSSVYIVTRSCYEYAYGQSAVLDYEQGTSGNRLLFSRTDECRVEGVYRPNANLTRVGDDLYRDLNSGRYIKTFACYEYSYGEDAIVRESDIIFVTSFGARCDRGI